MTRHSKLIGAAGILGIGLLAVAATASRANETASPHGKQPVAGQQLTAGEETSTQPVAFLQKKAKKKRKRARGRLPNYYSRVGISDAQRTKIYGIQRMHAQKIADLEKQLKELKEKRDKEVEAVLTPDQLKKVQEFVEAARRKRAERAKSRKKSAKKSTTKPKGKKTS